MMGRRDGDETRPQGAPAGAGRGSPAVGSAAEALHAGLDPEALFAGVTFLDEQQTVQWLGHLQRLASTGLLAGGMAHDLAGLLQPLLFEAERALLDDDARTHREALVRMRELARRSEDYVRALLTLVRRDEHHRVAVPVESVVEDTLGLLASMKRLVGVSVTRNLDNRHMALVDRTRLMQAVLNLVTNAVRAARQGGHEVTIGVRGWRGWVLIEVEDNGPGVPPELAGRIFQPFVHATPLHGSEHVSPHGVHREGVLHEGVHGHNVASPDGTRTGLGLYITKRLVEEQGGRIEFETEPGVGTVFRLMLEPAPVDGASTQTSERGPSGTDGRPQAERGEDPE